MSLRKQLYIIISIIFLMIFIGNFIITVQNTKEYLEQESSSKAKDSATSLGMMLKSLITNKKDSEITSIINAIGDSGFYKSIRLEDAYYSVSDREILKANTVCSDLSWNIKNVSIDKKYGEILIDNEENLLDELSQLQNGDTQINTQDKIVEHTYTIIPSSIFRDNDTIRIDFQATQGDKVVKTYSELKLSKILVNSQREVRFDSVPQWFIDMIPINLIEQKSEINDGWKVAAVIFVSANPGIAYEKLYKQVKNAFYYSLISFLFSMFIVAFFINIILKPLKEIEKLANKISKGSFEYIEKLPWTNELKSVSIAMNTMSSKIKNIIQRLNKNIEDISQELTKDQLTGLEIKQTFDVDIKNVFAVKESGYIYLIKISNLAQFANTHGKYTVNNFLIDFASILQNIENSKAYRFFGSEFAMMSKNFPKDEIRKILETLKYKFEELGKKYNIDDVAHIGVVPFNQFDSVSLLLSSVTEAYEMAKQIGPNEGYIKEQNAQAKGLLEWKELVSDIVDNDKFDIEYIGDIFKIDDKKQLIIQEAFAKIVDKNNQLVPIGTFISIAEEHQKVLEFDKKVVLKVIDYIIQHKIKHKIAINLSFESIKDSKFIYWLESKIKDNSHISEQLLFSLTAYNIAKYQKEFKNFTNIIKQNGCQIMIKRFDIKFININQIKEFNPDCIRLLREYTTDIENDSNKKTLLDSICKITELLDIKVYAENVKNDKDFDMICDFGLTGLSR